MSGRILIVDDVATNRIVLKVKLASACYQVLQASNWAEAIEVAVQDKPDIILLSANVAESDGIEICEDLKRNPACANIPVIMISPAKDRCNKLRALRAGADEFLVKPIDETMLLARIRSLLRTRDTAEELRLREETSQHLGFAEQHASFDAPVNIALITVQNETGVKWEKSLSELLNCNTRISARKNALALAEGHPAPDILIIEGSKGCTGDGLHLVSELRSRAKTRHAVIIVVLDKSESTECIVRKTVAALDIGANDVLAEGFDPEEMVLRLNRQILQKRQADRLRKTLHDGLRLAVIDPLTGLFNRRYAMPHLARIARSSCKPYALMLLDLDRFKSVNDIYGHSAGDDVLREVGQRLRSELRSLDLVARIGGEEFMVVMPDTSLKEAERAAERLRKRINETPVKLASFDQSLSISLSIGVAMGGGDTANPNTEEILDQADRALYAAKADGRNQVIISRSAA